MRVCGIFTFLKRMCKAHFLAKRGHLRQTTASRVCASPAHNAFYVIGNSIGISYYIKKQTTTGNHPSSCLPNHFILGVSSIYYCASAAYTFSFSASFSLKIFLNRKRTNGPAKNSCQQNAIGKFNTVVSNHTAIICEPAFLNNSVATRLISGHIHITDLSLIHI